MYFRSAAALLLIVWCFGARAASVSVCPSGCDYANIQSAIGAIEAGDTVRLTMTMPHTEANIIIDKDVVIQGLGQQQTVVQAALQPHSGSGRVFSIESGNTVILQDFTIRHGDAPAGSGGGIWIQPPTTQSKVTLNRITLLDNRAVDVGGGISNEGSLDVRDFFIAENEGLDGGGGIHNSGNLALVQGTVDSNNGYSQGGGIFSANAGNSQPSLSVVGVNVQANVASQGAGIYNAGAMTISGGSKVNLNEGIEAGGAIYNNASSLVTIDNTSITANKLLASSDTVVAQGVGVYTKSPMRITESTISANQGWLGLSANSDSAGGGLYISNTQVTLERVLLLGNEHPRGGGLYATESSVIIAHSSVWKNRADILIDAPFLDFFGGGIFQDRGSMRITNTGIFDNRAVSSGGGIYQCGGELQLSHVTIAKNMADSYDSSVGEGGGLFVECSSSTTEIRNSIIADNTVGAAGVYPDCNAPFVGSYSMIGDPGPGAGVQCSVGTLFQLGMLYNIEGEVFGPITGLNQDLGQAHVLALPLIAPSLAIDAGTCADLDGNPLAFDQRDAPMPVDGDGDGEAACDMGAVEFGSKRDAIFLNGFE